MATKSRSETLTGTRCGPYTLMRRIAVGGMAHVYVGHAADDSKQVVIKRMLPQISATAGAREMFEEEARLGALIRHPNVVRVLAFGDEGLHPWLALEHVGGLDMRRFVQWLTRGGHHLGTELAVYVVRELLAGLEAVHTATDGDGERLVIVHRDVSPSNVLLSVEGAIKLGDFGIARSRMEPKLGRRTEGGRGKLGYVSPEQLRGVDPDQRADVYAAAVMMAELLMGHPLFKGGSEMAILLAIRDGEIRPFREHAANLPMGLRVAVLEALARMPDDRTPTAKAFRDALAPFAPTEPDVLRAELGQLIKIACAADDGAPEGHATREMRLPSEGTTPLMLSEEEVGRITATPALTYAVESADGRQLGVFTLAQAIEGVATGNIGAEDIVSSAGGEPQRVREIPALRLRLPASTSLTGLTTKQGAGTVPERRLPLEHGGIIEALARSALDRENGLLLCEHSGIRKEVYLVQGTPQFVTSNVSSELFGEYLVRRRIIARGELDMALAVMPRFEARLGDTLAALGLVEPTQLLVHIGEQVRDKLLDLFLWERGHAHFYQGVPAPESGFPLELSAWDILAQGIDLRFERGLEQATFETRMLDCLTLRPERAEALEAGLLPSEARRLLNILGRGPSMLTEVVELLDDLTGKDPRRPYRAVRLLLALEVVEWETPES